MEPIQDRTHPSTNGCRGRCVGGATGLWRSLASGPATASTSGVARIPTIMTDPRNVKIHPGDFRAGWASLLPARDVRSGALERAGSEEGVKPGGVGRHIE